MHTATEQEMRERLAFYEVSRRYYEQVLIQLFFSVADTDLFWSSTDRIIAKVRGCTCLSISLNEEDCPKSIILKVYRGEAETIENDTVHQADLFIVVKTTKVNERKEIHLDFNFRTRLPLSVPSKHFSWLADTFLPNLRAFESELFT